MTKRYDCAIDKAVDSLRASHFPLHKGGRGVHIDVRRKSTATSSGSEITIVLSQQDAMDLATAILDWVVQGTEMGD